MKTGKSKDSFSRSSYNNHCVTLVNHLISTLFKKILALLSNHDYNILPFSIFVYNSLKGIGIVFSSIKLNFLHNSKDTPHHSLCCYFLIHDVICVVLEVTPEHKSNLNAVAQALTSSGEWGSCSLYITDCSAQ